MALDIGDYHIMNGDLLELCIERKTVADLASSISDGRHREQKARLSSLGADKILFIIEGDPFQQVFKSRINPYTVWSSIINTIYRDGYRLLITRNYRETQELIATLIIKIHKTGLIAGKTGGHETALSTQIQRLSKKREALTPEFLVKNFLASINGISFDMAEEICGCMDVTTISQLSAWKAKPRDEFVSALNERYQDFLISSGRPRRAITAIATKIYDML
jgi:ERCC4-type nuclease